VFLNDKSLSTWAHSSQLLYCQLLLIFLFLHSSLSISHRCDDPLAWHFSFLPPKSLDAPISFFFAGIEDLTQDRGYGRHYSAPMCQFEIVKVLMAQQALTHRNWEVFWLVNTVSRSFRLWLGSSRLLNNFLGPWIAVTVPFPFLWLCCHCLRWWPWMGVPILCIWNPKNMVWTVTYHVTS
jgi:hypothetical protein